MASEEGELAFVDAKVLKAAPFTVEVFDVARDADVDKMLLAVRITEEVRNETESVVVKGPNANVRVLLLLVVSAAAVLLAIPGTH